MPLQYEHNNKPESRYETCESLPKYSPEPPDINALSAPSYHDSAAENCASENAGRITLIRVKVVGREFHANSKNQLQDHFIKDVQLNVTGLVDFNLGSSHVATNISWRRDP